MADLRKNGYFIFEIDTTDSIPWPTLKIAKYVRFVDGFLLSATGATAKGEDFLSLCDVDVPHCMFTNLLASFFNNYEKFAGPMFRKPEGECLRPLSFSVLKFSRKLSLVAQLVDTDLAIHDDIISGYRLIFFDKPVTVQVDLFNGGASPDTPTTSEAPPPGTPWWKIPSDFSFQGQRKTFWEDFQFIDGETGFFNKGAYLNTSGYSTSIELRANQVLLLPSPCSFRPLASKDDYYMATAYLPSYGADDPAVEAPSLALGLSAGTIRTRFPVMTDPYFTVLESEDKEALVACELATIEQDMSTLRVLSKTIPTSASRHSIWPPSAQKVRLLQQGVRATRPAAEGPSSQDDAVVLKSTQSSRKTVIIPESLDDEDHVSDQAMSDGDDNSLTSVLLTPKKVAGDETGSANDDGDNRGLSKSTSDLAISTPPPTKQVTPPRRPTTRSVNKENNNSKRSPDSHSEGDVPSSKKKKQNN